MASGNSSPRHILLTGIPGVGKTTLMCKIKEALRRKQVSFSGFVTEEVRVSGRRIGFDVVTSDGHRGQLARVSDASNELPGANRRQPKVGQYTVNLLAFEQTALPTLQVKKGQHSSIFLVDEVGKMELFSSLFVNTIHKLLRLQEVTLVATIPVPKGRPISLVEEMRNGTHSLVFEVTRENRDTILPDILSAIQTSAQVNLAS